MRYLAFNFKTKNITLFCCLKPCTANCVNDFSGPHVISHDGAITLHDLLSACKEEAKQRATRVRLVLSLAGVTAPFVISQLNIISCYLVTISRVFTTPPYSLTKKCYKLPSELSE